MMSYSDYQADRYEEQEAAQAMMAYEEECEAGYEGSFEEFVAEVKASRKPAPAPLTDDLCDDDIPF